MLGWFDLTSVGILMRAMKVFLSMIKPKCFQRKPIITVYGLFTRKVILVNVLWDSKISAFLYHVQE